MYAPSPGRMASCDLPLSWTSQTDSIMICIYYTHEQTLKYEFGSVACNFGTSRYYSEICYRIQTIMSGKKKNCSAFHMQLYVARSLAVIDQGWNIVKPVLLETRVALSNHWQNKVHT